MLVCICLPSELAFDGLVWGRAEEYGDARLERAVLSCLFVVSRRLSAC